jgi:hypothetical protein
MVTFALVVLLAIPPQKAAAIERDQEKAQREVAEKYGNKKSSELSSDERREMSKDQAAADQQVLEKHNVEAKEWASSQSHRSRDEREEVKQEKVKQADKEKADAEAAKKKAAAAAAGADKPIPIQRGFSDANPVVLEEKPGAKPLVEEGLPADAKADQEAAAEMDRQNGGGFSGKPAGKPHNK